MLLAAVLNLLIARNSGCTDVALGTSVAGRTRSEIEGLIGFFVNQLVLRTTLSADATVDTLLLATRETVIGALDHQDVPFSTLVSELARARDSSRSPFFQLLFVLQDFPDEPLRMDGLQVSVWVDREQTAKFDLTLYAGQTDDGLDAVWLYDASLFSPGAIALLSRQIEHLLQQVLDRPDALLREIELMSDQDLAELEREKRERKQGKFGKLKAMSAHGAAKPGHRPAERNQA